jgi:hypothetical protein
MTTFVINVKNPTICHMNALLQMFQAMIELRNIEAKLFAILRVKFFWFEGSL